MPRPLEGTIATVGGVIGFGISLASTPKNADLTIQQALKTVAGLQADRLADSFSRTAPPTYALEQAQFRLHNLQAEPSAQVSTALLGVGLTLNLLSAIGHSRGNFWLPLIKQGSAAALSVEVISTLALNIGPQLLYALINQLQYLQTATQLGLAENIGMGIEIGILACALPKIPSILEGIRYVAQDAVIPVMVGVAKGTRDVVYGAGRGLYNTFHLRKRKQSFANHMAWMASEKDGKLAVLNRSNREELETFPAVLEQLRADRQAHMVNSLPEMEIDYDEALAKKVEAVEAMPNTLPPSNNRPLKEKKYGRNDVLPTYGKRLSFLHVVRHIDQRRQQKAT